MKNLIKLSVSLATIFVLSAAHADHEDGRSGFNDRRGDNRREDRRNQSIFSYSREGAGELFRPMEEYNADDRTQVRDLVWDNQLKGFKSAQYNTPHIFTDAIAPGLYPGLIRFTAPKEGYVVASTIVKDLDGKCGVGATFEIRVNKEILKSHKVYNQSREVTLSVEGFIWEGDNIDFIVNAKLDNDRYNECDMTGLNPTIEFVRGDRR